MLPITGTSRARFVIGCSKPIIQCRKEVDRWSDFRCRERVRRALAHTGMELHRDVLGRQATCLERVATVNHNVAH